MSGDPQLESEQHPSLADTAVALACARTLMRARSRDDVVGVLLDAAEDLGAALLPPSESDPWQLPVDLTFGLRAPLCPSADPANLRRLRLTLPGIVEDARLALERLSDPEAGAEGRSSRTPRSRGIDATTG